MKITIVYDNTAFRKDLEADWGFSALLEFQQRKILFDTGAKGKILLENMGKLNISPKDIDEVFISHAHWDHTGGLKDFLEQNNKVTLYVPPSYKPPSNVKKIVEIKRAKQIHENVFSTGELKGIEQSLGIKTKRGLVVIVGCSHPGVGNILKAISQFGETYALIGGLHGFKEFALLQTLSLVCPTHCTQHKAELKKLYPKKYTEGGAGKIIEI